VRKGDTRRRKDLILAGQEDKRKKAGGKKAKLRKMGPTIWEGRARAGKRDAELEIQDF